ncbi:suppressor of deletion of TFIIS [Coemansia thaxteri]|uniref:Suppressor of deletion of TFIIS n=1 Tax=Coemansia thaxteri TaxID=2663907 RepID=A0A9W8EL64_9FUNG|nr:suppressor of deletion of TFIIS [Coemansia thaxteri]KAJ2008357.1 suppressor of deletion of TFIIS [Coemansia thaxteri]KAJ2473187.1 suppressor of deletion of TFIIS [Coemansia sp. RSA 2322]
MTNDSGCHERIFFFDIDNCLYSPELGIDRLMKERIFALGRDIGLDSHSVEDTCNNYYKDYGLTVRGLVKHHGVDAAAFNGQVNGSLPIESLISPDPALRQMLLSIKTRRWAFTNADIDHARRVLKSLEVDDLFEGITFCDYSEPDFACKPERIAYEKAMREAGVVDARLCYFADDNAQNIEAAIKTGWTSVLVAKKSDKLGSATIEHHIEAIHELPLVLPHLFA